MGAKEWAGGGGEAGELLPFVQGSLSSVCGKARKAEGELESKVHVWSAECQSVAEKKQSPSIVCVVYV